MVVSGRHDCRHRKLRSHISTASVNQEELTGRKDRLLHLKAYPQWLPSSRKAAPPKPPLTVLPAENQGVTYAHVFSFKPAHNSTEVSI